VIWRRTATRQAENRILRLDLNQRFLLQSAAYVKINELTGFGEE
jgi:hypothetical protein